MQKQDASIIFESSQALTVWCLFEHLARLDASKPPEVVFVGVTKLAEVYKLIEGQRNSEWMRIFGAGGVIMVRIVGTSTDRSAIHRAATEHARSLPTMPRCNLHGINLKGMSRRLICSNGKVYDNQKAASNALGVAASSISRHLRGELKSVGGYTFAYEVKRDA